MSNTRRNRAEGWQHAKVTGHKNEEKIAELIKSNFAMQKRLLECAHLDSAKISVTKIEYGGLCESEVDCILGGKTKSKTDISLHLSNGNNLNVSIKKDDGGQVFLIGIERFVSGFEAQYKKQIPQNVKRAITLYFGSASDTREIISKYGVKKSFEKRKNRLVAQTLRSYDVKLAEALIDWFNENICEIFDFCFAKGLAKNQGDWAEIVWYKNMFGENSFDTMIYLPDMLQIPKNVEYGNRNGGSTIQLPFGFVQWHSPKNIIPGNLQFHHTYKKMLELCE